MEREEELKKCVTRERREKTEGSLVWCGSMAINCDEGGSKSLYFLEGGGDESGKRSEGRRCSSARRLRLSVKAPMRAEEGSGERSTEFAKMEVLALETGRVKEEETLGHISPVFRILLVITRSRSSPFLDCGFHRSDACWRTDEGSNKSNLHKYENFFLK